MAHVQKQLTELLSRASRADRERGRMVKTFTDIIENRIAILVRRVWSSFACRVKAREGTLLPKWVSPREGKGAGAGAGALPHASAALSYTPFSHCPWHAVWGVAKGTHTGSPPGTHPIWMLLQLPWLRQEQWRQDDAAPVELNPCPASLLSAFPFLAHPSWLTRWVECAVMALDFWWLSRPSTGTG